MTRDQHDFFERAQALERINQPKDKYKIEPNNPLSGILREITNSTE